MNRLRLAISAALLGLGAGARASEIKLAGLTVRLGQPIEVTRQIGWEMDWPHASYEPSWSFIHLTPSLERFPGGNLIATYTLDPDTRENPICVSGFQISGDGGRHWGRRYSVLMQHNPMIFIPKGNDSLLALGSELMAGSDPHTLTSTAYLFEHGGSRMVMIPDGIRIVDWPWPAGLLPGVQPRENWVSAVTLMGSFISEGGLLLATAYGPKVLPTLEHKYTNCQDVLLASKDGGYTWRYYSTIAEYEPVHNGEEHYEGPDEISVIRLADGDLMAAFRVGGARRWQLRRAYSHDGGRTWSKTDILPAWSVDPVLHRLANGTVALTTGRPGIFLWIADDPRATHWQSVDLMAFHNAWAPDPSQRIGSFEAAGQKRYETTSYTGLVETSPNHLLIVYDRDPERPPQSPRDLSRVYALPIEIERN